MTDPETNEDSQTLALRALAWCLQDARRAERLLDLTGLTTNELRARAVDPDCQAAVLGFLESHEPDLIACAEALAVRPESLVRAKRELEA
jgi:hypothetical protein